MPHPAESEGRLSNILDAVVDGAAMSFLVWTALYELALATGASLWLAVEVWVPVALVILLLIGVRSWRSGSVVPSAGSSDLGWSGRRTPQRRDFVLSATGLLAVGATVLALRQQSSELDLLLWLAVAGTLLALVASARPHDSAPPIAGGAVRIRSTYVVVLAALGAAVLASLLFHTDADDVYYVNRATWVAQHGTAALRDTMFGPQTYPNTYAGGVVPLASVEALVGALAHLVGVSGASMTYLVSVPIVAFFAVWILWRLVRIWAPQRPLAAFLVALAFVLFSGASVVGNYSFGRLWQGKVMADVLIIPLIWFWATRLVARRRRTDLGFMFVLGGCFVGLTSTASLLGPVMSAALLVAAAILRSRQLAMGALLLGAAPVASGFVVLATSDGGPASPPAAPWTTFEIAAGSRPWMAALGVVALVLAPLLARRGAPAVLAAAASLIFFGSMLPGLMDLINQVTGAGPVLWRFSLAAPLAAMVGLIGTVGVRLHTSGRQFQSTWLLTVGLIAVIAAVGVPIWSPAVGASLTSKPTWKIDPSAKAAAVRISRLPVGAGPVLLPPAEMQALSVTTSRMFAVVPRDYYVGSLDEPAKVTQDRMRLFRLVAHQDPLPSRAETRSALNRLHVPLVCVSQRDVRVLRSVRWSGYRLLTAVGDLNCLVPRSGLRPVQPISFRASLQ